MVRPRASHSALGSHGDDMARLYNTYTEKQWKSVLHQMSAQLEGGQHGGSGGDRNEQDIAILNSCFDDIEKFIERLQHAAAVQRELEQHRRSRGARRSIGSGSANTDEAILALRTRPPPERDFVDVLQKFKLSLNLLARLQAHIYDPNAPELVHLLFTPLALIVDAAQDAVVGSKPARVVQPLLTCDALNLLANCLTSKETKLWHSLGDAWLIPREQWKSTIPPYQPVFLNGWSPDYQVDDQPLRSSSPRCSSVGRVALATAKLSISEHYECDEPDLCAEQYAPYPRNMREMRRDDSGSVASSPDRDQAYLADKDNDNLGEAWVRGDVQRLYNTYTEKQWKAVLRQMSVQLEGGARGGSGGNRNDASSTGFERRYEQDIAILNNCFDDIEKFIARLQHAAAAQCELERRRGGAGSGAANAGKGMLALRTRPPPERDFVDVLQKFKLSFNLLARLQAHIRNPNAPELVHFLFTPLALIVDAAQDAVDKGKPARVVQPLLTRDALNLLANCVTSNENELWHSLGDAWLIPRDQWKTTIPPYQPVFTDGWSPDYQVDDQTLRSSSPRRRSQGRAEPATSKLGSNPTGPAGRAAGNHGIHEGHGDQGPVGDGGQGGVGSGAAGAADWVPRKRLGKKGEFRYF